MDESTSALDPISTSKIEDLAMELKNRYTVIMVTHNMQQAVRVSDKTAFFLLGELVEFGDTERVFSHPQEKRTEEMCIRDRSWRCTASWARERPPLYAEWRGAWASTAA